MKTRDIYEVRSSVEQILRERADGLDRGRVRPRVIVTVNPANEIDVMVVSPAFEGVDLSERDAMLWPPLEESLTPAELERIDRWDLLTLNEAKKVYPSTLRARSPRVRVAPPAAGADGPRAVRRVIEEMEAGTPASS
ncbi:MAG TPA: hypothetical protein VGM37_16650 [Armatimonadota bacterium]|jgi:hypothetical protein